MFQRGSQPISITIPLKNQDINSIQEKILSLEEPHHITIQVNQDIEQIEELIQFASIVNHSISLDYNGADKELKRKIAAYNARLKLIFLSAQQQDSIFEFAIDNKTNTLILNLKPDKKFNFDDETALDTLIKIMGNLSEGSRIRITYSDIEQIYLPDFFNLIGRLSEENLVYHLSLSGPEPELQTRYNQIADNYFRHAVRSKKIDLNKINNVSEFFRKRPQGQRKVRRAKLMYNRGQRMQVQLQHQHHVAHEVQQQQVQVQQRQQQVQQQQVVQREAQLQQQMQRMQNIHQNIHRVNVNGLGILIHKGNLQLLENDDFSLNDIKRIWTALVGPYARYVKDSNNKITHVPLETMHLILQHKDQFSDGIDFENLPNGFGFMVRREMYDWNKPDENHKSQSILYFNSRLEAKSQEERKDSFLAPRIEADKNPLDDIGTVGQFYHFLDHPDPHGYSSFVHANQNYFQTFFYPDGHSVQEQADAFIALIHATGFKLPDQDDLQFSAKNFQGLRCLLLDQGPEGVLTFLMKLQQLKDANQYDHFKTLFMDTSDDWRSLAQTSTSRKGELNAYEAIDYLCSMSVTERMWWETLTAQHLKANECANLMDLVNAQHYFFAELKKIDRTLALPTPCPLENISNMKTAYARLLYVLNKAINPQEQVKHLDKLDFGMQGVICGASRGGPYYFLSKEMEITPASGITDWSKFAKFAPMQREYDRGYFNTTYTEKQVTEFTEQGYRAYYQAYHPVDGAHDHTEVHYDQYGNWCGSSQKYTTEWEKEILLTRDENGFLISKTTAFAPHAGGIVKNITPVDNHEMQDESFMTSNNPLAYGMNFGTFRWICNRLHYPENARKYFYRLVGTERFAFKFKIYQNMIERLGALRLEENELVSADERTRRMHKNLLPFLAICTMGKRVMQASRNIQAEWSEWLHFIKIHAEELEQNEILEYVINNYHDLDPPLTLREMKALLTLIMDGEYLDPERDISLKALCGRCKEHGEMFYALITNLSLHPIPPTLEQINYLIRDIIDPCIGLITPSQNENFLLLISLLDPKEWSKLSEIYTDIAGSMEGLNHPDILLHLKTVLSKIEMQESTPVSTSDIANLIGKLSRLSGKEEDLAIQVYDITVQSLPGIKFKDEEVSNTLAFFIREMAPFAKEMEESFAEFNNELNNAKNEILNNTPPEVEQFKPLILNIIASLERFLNNCLNEIEQLIQLLNEVQNNRKNKPISKALHQIQRIINVVSDPLKDFATGNTLIDYMVIPMLQPFINIAKGYVLEAISTHLVGTLKAVISENINALSINDAILNKTEEADIKLSSRLNDFLLSQLPNMTGKEIALEINACFKSFEELEPFIKCLQDYKNKPARDALLAVLYRRHYFDQAEKLLNIEALTEIFAYLNLCKKINTANVLDTLFTAHNNKVSIASILSLLAALAKNEDLFQPEQFYKLLQIGLECNNGRDRVQYLIAIQAQLAKNTNPACAQAFTVILAKADTIEMDLLAELHAALTHHNDKDLPLIAAYVVRSEHKLSEVGELMQGLKRLSADQHSAALSILNASLWQRDDEDQVDLKTQLDLVHKLAQCDGQALITLNGILYKHKPNPGFSALHEIVNKPKFNRDALSHWMQSYELDPWGKLAKVKNQFDVRGAETFISNITYLQTGNKILPNHQQELMDGFAYITSITHQYCLPIPPHGSMKPLLECTRKELNAFYADCIQRFQQHPDRKTQLQALAALCVCMFRTTGKYPYHSQIISVLNTLVVGTSLFQEIPTGQGKSITNALIAAMNHSFSIQGADVCVGSRNKFLAQRDYQESRDFYTYLNIPVALVTSTTEKNYYENSKQPVIKYTTAADISLYESKLTLIDKVALPPKHKRIYVGDEFDAEALDNKCAFNFSTGDDDPYVNPLKWLYPLANQFITSGLCNSEKIYEDDDLYLFRQYAQDKNPEQFALHEDKLTDHKLGQFLDSAWGNSAQMVENIDYLVRTKTREVHGKQEIISEAHYIDPSSHEEQKESTLSLGVQQLLHADLNKKYETEIALYESTHGEEGIPPFSCDNQIECVDSQNAQSTLQKFGRIFASSGTGGKQADHLVFKNVYGIETQLKIPPRRQGKLENLGVEFCAENTSWFFGALTHYDAIKRRLNHARSQPVMISCKNIEKVEALYAKLSNEFPADRVQVIHAGIENYEEFNNRVKKAGNPGMITIITPLAGRGVDVKTGHAKSSQPLSKQEEILQALAETMLLIEAHPEATRIRRQIWGRTSRDGKPGQIISIFDLNEILKDHGIDLTPLNHQEKVTALNRLIDKMDKEACMERHVDSQIHAILVAYQTEFNKQISLGNTKNKKKVLLANKAQFIERYNHLWAECLAASDPTGKYPNPVIRYDEEDNLRTHALDEVIADFAIKAKRLFTEIYGDEVEIQSSYTHDLDQALANEEAEQQKSSDAPKEPKQLLQAYLDFHQAEPSDYIQALQQKTFFDGKINDWIMKNPKIDDQLKEAVRHLQVSDVRFLITEQNTTQSYQQASILRLTKAMQEKQLTPEQLSTVLPLYAMVFHDLANEYQDQVLDEKNIDIAMKGFLKQAFKQLSSSELNQEDKRIIKALRKQIDKQSMLKLIDLQYVVNQLITLTQDDIKSPQLKSHLNHVMQFTNAIAIQHKAENDVLPDPKTDFKLMVWHIQQFLEKTSSRIENDRFKFARQHAEKKLIEINSVISYLDSDEAMDKFYNKHHQADKPLSSLLAELIHESDLHDVLALNTTFSTIRSGNTTAMREFDVLEKKLISTYSHDKDINESKQQSIKRYLDRLNNIRDALQSRKDQAFDFLKAPDYLKLYDTKIKKMDAYIAEVKNLLDYKKDHQIEDISSELLLMQTRVENDADVYKSTARFFASDDRVTIVKDIREATNEFLQSANEPRTLRR